jgi:cytoskeletal protein CcmA (bactofilin family)
VDILRNERTGQNVAAQQAASSPVTPRKDENPYTTLGKDTEFEGTLRFKEALKIEGKFNGDISSEGHLIIGKTGEVTAEINVGSIIVEGKITGNIIANDLVELRSSAELRGDITAAKLKIEEGVLFVGRSDVQPQNAKKDMSKPASKPQQEDKKEKAASNK